MEAKAMRPDSDRTLPVLSFRSGPDRYLVRLEAVRAVVRLRGLRRLPGSSGALAGVLDIQENPVAIYDARSPRPGEHGEHGEHGDVLVLAAGWPEHAIGVACDGVEGLLNVVMTEASPDSAAQAVRLPHYVEALLLVEGALVPLVDVVGLAEATSDVALENARFGEPRETLTH